MQNSPAAETIKEPDQNHTPAPPKERGQCNVVYSKIFQNGTILETIYDPVLEDTHFVVVKNGRATKMGEFEYNGKTYIPPNPSNPLIERRFVKLPSCVDPNCGDEKYLIKEIQSFIHAYVQLSAEFEKIAAYYVLLSWTYDAFQELSYLRVLGDFGSGKSRFLKVVGSLCYKSVFLSGAASISASFRIINEIKGTFVLDEADWRFSDTTSEIIKILNQGFSKGVPVLRSEPKSKNLKSFEPVAFDVFCPKIIATRRSFVDEALESRCLTASMESLTRDDIKENLDEEFEREALWLRNKLLAFRLKKMSNGIQFTSLPGIRIEPRLRQIITPLYSVVQTFEARQEILQFIKNQQRELTDARYHSFEGELLKIYFELLEKQAEPLIQDITAGFNQKNTSNYPVKPKKVGAVFDQIFHLQKKRISDGYCIVYSEANRIQLEKLKKKYGLEGG